MIYYYIDDDILILNLLYSIKFILFMFSVDFSIVHDIHILFTQVIIFEQ